MNLHGQHLEVLTKIMDLDIKITDCQLLLRQATNQQERVNLLGMLQELDQQRDNLHNELIRLSILIDDKEKLERYVNLIR